MKTTTTEKQSHSEQQAIAQLESIIEMVRALDKESAAQDWAKAKSREAIIQEFNDGGMEFDSESTDDELREEMVDCVVRGHHDPSDFEFDEDSARETIQEDALSVQVRSDWYSPGDSEGRKPGEFEILLCTGGPAVRLIGELSEHCEPDSVRLQHQDWGTPWTEHFLNSNQREYVLTYCRQFYFGE